MSHVFIYCLVAHSLLETEDFWICSTSQSHSDRWMRMQRKCPRYSGGLLLLLRNVVPLQHMLGAVERTTSWLRRQRIYMEIPGYLKHLQICKQNSLKLQ